MALDQGAAGFPAKLTANVRDYLSQHADEFGGEYVGKAGLRQYVVIFTGHLDEHRKALQAIYAYPQDLIVQGATFSLQQLDSTQSRIFGDRTPLLSHGVDLTVVGANIRHNVVSVGVSTLTQSVVDELQKRYPTPDWCVQQQQFSGGGPLRTSPSP
jgi:hypothetical protein